MQASARCNICVNGTFTRPGFEHSDQLQCDNCLDDATCGLNTSVATVDIASGFWRLGPRSRELTRCWEEKGRTACRGGNFANASGEGYCFPGFTGPLCQLCEGSESEFYFNKEEIRCEKCPEIISMVLTVFAIGLGSLFVVRIAFTQLKIVRTIVLGIWDRMRKLAVLPKGKLMIAFFQCVAVLPNVYNLKPPPTYFQWLGWLTLFEADVFGFAFPGSCMPGGFAAKLTLRGVAPLCLLTLLFFIFWFSNVVSALIKYCRGVVDEPAKGGKKQRKHGIFVRSILDAMPLALFLGHFLCAPTSAAVFSSWSCQEFAVDSTSAPSVAASFSRSDLSLKCADVIDGVTHETDEFKKVKNVSYVFIGIWSIFMPVLFAALLIPSHAAIRKGQSSELLDSTAFLHREYRAHFFWWEPFFLLQRIIIVGFVQYIDRKYQYFRLMTGLFIALSFLVSLLGIRPYKRWDLNVVAIAFQAALVMVFLASQTVQLFNELDDEFGADALEIVFGSTSLHGVVTVLIAINFGTLICFFCFIGTQAMFEEKSRKEVELAKQRLPLCDWRVDEGQTFACFLSHFKRDTGAEARYLKDAMEEVLASSVYMDAALERNRNDRADLKKFYDAVDVSETLVLLLSADLFSQPSCLLEVYQALKKEKPIVLVKIKGKPFSFDEVYHLLRDLEAGFERNNKSAAIVELKAHLDNTASPNELGQKIRDALELGVRTSQSAAKPDDVDSKPRRTSRDMISSMRRGSVTGPRRPSSEALAELKTITVAEVNLTGSSNQLEASLIDLAEAMASVTGRTLKWKKMQLTQDPEKQVMWRRRESSKDIDGPKDVYLLYNPNVEEHALRIKGSMMELAKYECISEVPTTQEAIKFNLEGIPQSKFVVFVQSSEVLTIPWVLLALFMAAVSRVPIICVRIEHSGYLAEEARQYLEDLQTRLPAAASDEMKAILASFSTASTKADTTLSGLQKKLADKVPSLISVPYQKGGSVHQLNATVRDVITRQEQRGILVGRLSRRTSSMDKINITSADVVLQQGMIGMDEESASPAGSTSRSGSAKSLRGSVGSAKNLRGSAKSLRPRITSTSATSSEDGV